MESPDFKQKLADFCAKTFRSVGLLADVRRLSGGASMESWSFIFDDEAFVLRRLPKGISRDEEGMRGISLATQADIIDLAVQSEVTAPIVRARLKPEDGLGEGFIMDKAEGETLPHKILGKPEFAEAESRLTEQCALELWRIHNMVPENLPEPLEYLSPAQLIDQQRERYDEIGGAIPIFEYAFHWLQSNAPASDVRKIVHGDFRMGNLMITSSGLSAVLDWELTRLGDPIQDLAYLCTPSWRFGHYEKVAGGFDTAEAFLAAYASHGGETVDPERFRYWLIYSTLWWGVSCLLMGEIWRSNGDRSLERTVIGRRVSEVEIDLALLFEGILPSELCTPIDWQSPTLPEDRGEISYDELLTALGEWNKEKVQPDLKGHDMFQSRVAGNALGIAQRHACHGQTFQAASDARLKAIGLDHGQLCAALSEGRINAEYPGLWDHFRLSALERLSIDQPKYAGLEVALNKWRP